MKNEPWGNNENDWRVAGAVEIEWAGKGEFEKWSFRIERYLIWNRVENERDELKVQR